MGVKCEQLAQWPYVAAPRLESNPPRSVDRKPVAPLGHTTDGKYGDVPQCTRPEMTTGQRVTGQVGQQISMGHVGHRSVLDRDPLTHDQVNNIPRTGYFVAVMMFDFESASTHWS